MVAAVLVFYVFSLLLEDSADISKKVELKKETLLKQREILTRKSIYETQLDLYKRQLQNDMSRMLPGDSPNVAISNLGKTLEDFANQSGVEITTKTPQNEKRVDDKLVRVSIQIQATCVLDQLVQFLAAIESHEKLLVVSEFRLYSVGLRAGFGPNQRRNEMRPSLTVSGYINVTAAKSKTSTGS